MRKLIFLLFTTLFIPSIALATSKNPEQIVKAWGNAVQHRDGKKQYQLLCPQQQAKNRATLAETNWVTGVSSPRVETYKIEKVTHQKGITSIVISYQLKLQDKIVGTVSDLIQVKNGCISQFKYLSPAAEGPL